MRHSAVASQQPRVNIGPRRRSCVQAVPANVRNWFASLDSKLAAALEKYTALVESPLLLQQELAGAVALKNEDGALEVRTSRAAREVYAAIEVDEGVTMRLTIQLPSCFPLRPAEACTCFSALGGNVCDSGALRSYPTLTGASIRPCRARSLVPRLHCRFYSISELSFTRRSAGSGCCPSRLFCAIKIAAQRTPC